MITFDQVQGFLLPTYYGVSALHNFFLDNQLSNEAQNHENSNVPKHAKWWHALGLCSFCLPLVLLSEGFAVLNDKLEIWSRTRKRKSRKMRC